MERPAEDAPTTPWSALSLALRGQRSFALDCKVVVCGTDGVAVFDALHRRRKAADAILFQVIAPLGSGPFLALSKELALATPIPLALFAN
jgi:hypothetical protein